MCPCTLNRHSHIKGFVRSVCRPRSAADMSSPSSFKPSGSSTPASEQIVGSQSTPPITLVSSTFPAGEPAGHRTINGIRTPPSYRLRLRPRRGPGLPTPLCEALLMWISSGPLSLEKTTTVFPARPSSSSLAISRPICLSASVTTL